MWQTSAASIPTQGEERNRNARRPFAPEPSAFRPGRAQATGIRTGPGLTDEGGEDSVGVNGIGDVVARARVAEVWRSRGSRYRRPQQGEAEVKEDAPGDRVIGDEGDDPEPVMWRGLRDLKIPGRGGATCRRGKPFVTKVMRPGVFLSIVEFTPGDTRSRESAWVVETIWRRRPSRRRLALFGSVLRDDFTPDSDADVRGARAARPGGRRATRRRGGPCRSAGR